MRAVRNPLHLAAMEHQAVSRIVTFDAGFDPYPGIARIAV